MTPVNNFILLPKSKCSLTGCHDHTNHLKQKYHMSFLRNIFELCFWKGSNKPLKDSDFPLRQRNNNLTVQ